MPLRIPTGLLLLLLLFTSTAYSQPDTSSWKKVVFKKFSFQHPNDWVVTKQNVPGSLVVGVTPDGTTEKLSMKAVEFIQVSPQGRSYASFKNDFVKGYAARVQNELKLVSRKDTTFKGLPAVKVKVILYPGSDDEIPAYMAAINGGSYFYLVTRLSFQIRDENTEEFDRLTESIFRTMVITK